MKKSKSFLYLLGSFLICILLLLFVLYRYTTQQLNSSLTNAAESRLSFSYQRLEEKSSEIEQLASSIMMENDVRYLARRINDEKNQYEYVQNLKKIKDIIRQRVENSSGVQAVHIYWPEEGLLLSTKPGFSLEDGIVDLSATHGEKWQNIEDQLYFSVSYPYIKREKSPVEFIVYTEMKPSYLNDIRQSVTSLDNSKALLELPDGYIMYEQTEVDTEVINKMKSIQAGESFEESTLLDTKEMRILTKTGKRNQVRMISYYDVGYLMKPIIRINILTFVSTISVLLIGLFLMHLFYKNIFTKIDILIKQFKNIENGQLDITLPEETGSEFDYVFDQFNQMASGVKRLLGSLEKEYTLRDLAERKQLQAQINPHFLYNSLFYIVSMAENSEAVREMTMHLADYYQYRTETNDLVLLEEEIAFSHSYLSIISLRKQIDYHIHVEADISDIELLPLLIQPLLENAVLHGIDKKEGAYRVILNVYQLADELEISVTDDGNGLSEDEITSLLTRINQSQTEHQRNVGLRNINHRLINYYGRQSRLKIERDAELGGLKISFVILKEANDEAINCG